MAIWNFYLLNRTVPFKYKGQASGSSRKCRERRGRGEGGMGTRDREGTFAQLTQAGGFLKTTA